MKYLRRLICRLLGHADLDVGVVEKTNGLIVYCPRCLGVFAGEGNLRP